MKSYGDLQIGVATHTGCVRRTNEDDYLVLMPEDAAAVRGRGRLFAVADGMGGVIGGAEASRTAVRALSQAFLDADARLEEPRQRMREGFARACRRVYELSRESPNLRGMGTTLTALNLLHARMLVGHVGDSRCYLLRNHRLRQVTEDHAVRGREHRLTRCIGGGRAEEQVDVTEIELLRDDRFLLATDGLWETVSEEEMRRALAGLRPQAAANELVRLANARGGPDNSTALVVRVLQTNGELGTLREIELPAEEYRQTPTFPRSSPPLRAPRWPWLVLALAALLGGLALAKLNGIDVIHALFGRSGG